MRGGPLPGSRHPDRGTAVAFAIVPAVFVHGVPDTSELWAPIIERLSRRDIVNLRLPGFGEPVPAGFSCTKEAYAAWIVDQLQAIGEPVDLVGHDWGGLLTGYIGATEPDLVRTWTGSDAALDPDFMWHDLAQAWQTPEVGEQVMEAMSGDALVDGLRDAGHPDAAEVRGAYRRSHEGRDPQALPIGDHHRRRLVARPRSAIRGRPS